MGSHPEEGGDLVSRHWETFITLTRTMINHHDLDWSYETKRNFTLLVAQLKDDGAIDSNLDRMKGGFFTLLAVAVIFESDQGTQILLRDGDANPSLLVHYDDGDGRLSGRTCLKIILLCGARIKSPPIGFREFVRTIADINEESCRRCLASLFFMPPRYSLRMETVMDTLITKLYERGEMTDAHQNTIPQDILYNAFKYSRPSACRILAQKGGAYQGRSEYWERSLWPSLLHSYIRENEICGKVDLLVDLGEDLNAPYKVRSHSGKEAKILTRTPFQLYRYYASHYYKCVVERRMVEHGACPFFGLRNMNQTAADTLYCNLHPYGPATRCFYMPFVGTTARTLRLLQITSQENLFQSLPVELVDLILGHVIRDLDIPKYLANNSDFHPDWDELDKGYLGEVLSR